MADILLDEQAAPTAPAAGQGIIWPDSTASKLIYTDDAGRKWGFHRNFSVADQAVAAADVYLTASGLLIPSFGVQVGTRIIWYVSAVKTAASTAAAIWTVRIGAAQAVGDTARITLTQGAQSAVIDNGIAQIMVTVRSVSASGIIVGSVAWSGHHAAAVGFGNGVSAAGAAFDNSALGGLFIGLSVNGGTAAAWTLTQVQGEIFY